MVTTALVSPGPKRGGYAAADRAVSLNVRGDSALVMFVAAELRQSYSELPVRWLCDVVLTPWSRAAAGPAATSTQASASASLDRWPSFPRL